MRDAPLRLLYVAGSFPPAKSYGGPTESSYELCRHLIALGVEARVLAIAADGDRELPVEADRWTEFRGVPVFYARRLGRTFVAPRALGDLDGAWRRTDVAHISGSFSLLFLTSAARAARHGVPVVLSPRGMMLPEAIRDRGLKKRVFNETVGRLAYARVAAWHVTSEEERESARPLAGAAPIEVIPNGVLVPEARSWPRPEGAPYLAYLGRIHPHKEIERLIDAFAEGAAGSDVELRIAGNGERAYVAELEAFVARHPARARVRLVGHVGGAEKSAFLSCAEGLVLASRSESFGLSVAEALAHGTPCVVTRSAPWSGLEANACGFWVETSKEGVASGVRALLALPAAERRAMGARGRAWIERDLSWNTVASRMLALYESVRIR